MTIIIMICSNAFCCHLVVNIFCYEEKEMILSSSLVFFTPPPHEEEYKKKKEKNQASLSKQIFVTEVFYPNLIYQWE